jgi:hypothetical protein
MSLDKNERDRLPIKSKDYKKRVIKQNGLALFLPRAVVGAKKY